jgi:hypothetical protein
LLHIQDCSFVTFLEGMFVFLVAYYDAWLIVNLKHCLQKD